jgi:hypothetical protein
MNINNTPPDVIEMLRREGYTAAEWKGYADQWATEQGKWRKRAEQAEAELADWKECAERCASEKCPPDEQHCTCVPLLRHQLATAKATALREAAVLDGMGNCDGNCCSVLLAEAERIEAAHAMTREHA